MNSWKARLKMKSKTAGKDVEIVDAIDLPKGRTLVMMMNNCIEIFQCSSK